jgi:hypothetical protein
MSGLPAARHNANERLDHIVKKFRSRIGRALSGSEEAYETADRQLPQYVPGSYGVWAGPEDRGRKRGCV